MKEMKVFAPPVLALGLLCVPVFAHHGTAVSFDVKRVVELKGTVTEFNWRNPHSALFLQGKDSSGAVVTYAVEMGSPATLSKMGFTRHTFNPGDEVVLQMHPSFSNETTGEALERRFVINGKEVLAINPEAGREGN